jgi:FixJ family two-component response regulator
MKPKTIAVVDNDAPVRAALATLLAAAGYEVDCHASAESLLASGRLAGADCLLVDVRMPGMSGVELQQHLERMGAAIPIVFMTGQAAANVRIAGTVELLEKPFSDEALIGAIERAAAQSSARTRPAKK